MPTSKPQRPSLHKHRSRAVTHGLTRAPHRAFLRATGFDDAAFEKSVVGIVTTQGENTRSTCVAMNRL